MLLRRLTTATLLAAALGSVGCSTTRPTPVGSAFGHHPLLVEVARFDDAAPAAVAVSSEGRRFIAFPHLDARPALSVAELDAAGELQAYPGPRWNRWDGQHGPTALRSLTNAQALTVTRSDAGESLWILDAGQTGTAGVFAGGPKLIEVSLVDDRVLRVFYLDHRGELGHGARLTDLRVDALRQVAYVADCGNHAVVVVDLVSGTARSLMGGQAVTGPEAGVALRHTLRPDLPERAEHAEPAPAHGVAAIELSGDGETLFFHARSGRTLYAVPTAALRDDALNDAEIVARVERLGRTGSAIDGMVLDPSTGDLYLSAVERRGLRVRRADGTFDDVLGDDRFRWPDGLAVGRDGYVYVTDSARQYRTPFADDSLTAEPGALMRFRPGLVDDAKFAAIEARRMDRVVATAAADAEEARVQLDFSQAVERGESVLLSWQAERLAAIETQAVLASSDDELAAITPELEQARARVASAEQRVAAARGVIEAASTEAGERFLELAHQTRELDQAQAAVELTLLAERAGDVGGADIGVADVPTD